MFVIGRSHVAVVVVVLVRKEFNKLLGALIGHIDGIYNQATTRYVGIRLHEDEVDFVQVRSGVQGRLWKETLRHSAPLLQQCREVRFRQETIDTIHLQLEPFEIVVEQPGPRILIYWHRHGE